MILSVDVFLLVLRAFVGLVVAGHGAQKVFGAFQGQGMTAFRARVAQFGFPARPFAELAAFGEFLGGIALALGLLTPIVSAILAVDMLVAIWKVHRPKGFWVTKGGYEYPLTLLVVFSLFGLAGPGPYSIDQQLGIVSWSAPVFVILFVAGALLAVGAPRLRRATDHRDDRPAV
jgi:putative oxidoreductase